MPAYQASHVKDDEETECPEIVGSTDLREVFKEKDRIRGSFSINRHMFRQFEANSIENLVAQIQAAEDRTHVIASIDDGYHLVLEAKSVSPIIIGLGPAYEEVPLPGREDVAAQVIEGLKAEARHHREYGEDGNKNTILEQLGLEATEHDPERPETAAPGVPAPGMSAEERRKRREEEGRAPRTDEATAAPGGRDQGQERFNPLLGGEQPQQTQHPS